ncbi:hypothetical protein WS67_11325 [Burkholderia singularis]|uniref:Uncharacterized protein n=1 Tax=Burkholderia singularis TaxID=1503053 RepID=A0A118DP55_9BURK|nr:hypothetical protein WS67_11325 [Burkholderia singularis]
MVWIPVKRHSAGLAWGTKCLVWAGQVARQYVSGAGQIETGKPPCMSRGGFRRQSMLDTFSI